MCLSPHQEHDKTLFLLEQLQRQKFELEQQKREFEEQQQKLKQAELQVCCGTPVSRKGSLKNGILVTQRCTHFYSVKLFNRCHAVDKTIHSIE